MFAFNQEITLTHVVLLTQQCDHSSYNMAISDATFDADVFTAASGYTAIGSAGFTPYCYYE